MPHVAAAVSVCFFFFASSANGQDSVPECSNVDGFISTFWTCLGEEHGAVDFVLTNGSISGYITAELQGNAMAVSRDDIDDEDEYALIATSQFCSCLPPLNDATFCGHAGAAATVHLFQPWCHLKVQCPQLTTSLMRVSMKCTGNDFPPAARASACGDGVIYGDTVDVDGLPASVQCARAAEGFFNASLSAAGTSEASTAVTAALEDALRGEHRVDSYASLLDALRRDTQARLGNCMSRAHVSEAYLQLPIPLSSLFSDGSILSYHNLTQHSCATGTTHGYLDRALDRHSALLDNGVLGAEPAIVDGVITMLVVFGLFVAATFGIRFAAQRPCGKAFMRRINGRSKATPVVSFQNMGDAGWEDAPEPRANKQREMQSIEMSQI